MPEGVTTRYCAPNLDIVAEHCGRIDLDAADVHDRKSSLHYANLQV